MMGTLYFLAPAVAAALVSYLLTPLSGRLATAVGAVDLPGPRKVHQHPIPRLGGLAVVASMAMVAAAMLLRVVPGEWPLLETLAKAVGAGLIPIVAVSIADDIKTLKPGPKFAAHLLGAIIAVACGISLNSELHLFGRTITIGVLAFPLSVLWIVGVTNAFNLVDGLDGLSSGLALISSLSLAGVFLVAGQNGMACGVLVMAGALAGFLPHNLYPARMFLGDTGATAAGFVLAAFALKGGATLSAGFATLLPIFVLGMPIAETLISMTRRIMRRLEHRDAGGVFEPDRNHMHHRLLALGVDHPRAVFILYGAGLVLACAAFVSMFMAAHESALLVVALLLAGFLGVRRLGYDEFAVIRNGVALRVYEAPVLNQSMFIGFIDLVIVATGVYGAVALKTDDWNLALHRDWALGMIAVLAPITAIVFSRMGLYRGSWRLAGIEDFVRACCAVVIATLLGATARMLLFPDRPLKALFAIYALVAIVLVIASRASYQVLVVAQWRARRQGAPAVIYGAGWRGAGALRELLASFAMALHPVAFIDDDPEKAGTLVNGLPVVGSFRTMEAAIQEHGARAVILSCNSIPGERLAEIGEVCERLGVALLKMQVSLDPCTLEARTAAPTPRLMPVVAEAPRAAVVEPQPVPALAAVAAPAAPEGAYAYGVRFEKACVPGSRVPIVSGVRCPSCQSYKVHRSRAKNVRERVHKAFTQKRLHRCEHCGWRGWRQTLDPAISEAVPGSQVPRPNFDSIDAVLRARPSGAMAN